MIRRIQEKQILKKIHNDRIILIIGARQVGKTTILNNIHRILKDDQQDCYFFTLEDPLLLNDLNKHPEEIYNYIPKNNNKKYLLLDEIQYLKNPSNFLKYIYDLYNNNIKLIVTGSSAFYIDQKFKDSLVGRKEIIEIYPFTFSEFLLAKNQDKLSAAISKENHFATGTKKKLLKSEQLLIKQLWQEYIIYGGYPRVVITDDKEEKNHILKELYQSFLKKDVLEANIKNEIHFYILLKILSGQVGNLVNMNELSNIVSVSKDTINKYLYILQKSFVISLCVPFHKNIRKELSRMPKVYFFDNGYRNAILNNFTPIEQRIDKGMLLENHIFSELTKMKIEDIKFWRTQDKNEIDFIVNESLAFEVKSNKKQFKPKQYSKFRKLYPEIPLRLITIFDDEELDGLDFTS